MHSLMLDPLAGKPDERPQVEKAGGKRPGKPVPITVFQLYSMSVAGYV